MGSLMFLFWTWDDSAHVFNLKFVVPLVLDLE